MLNVDEDATPDKDGIVSDAERLAGAPETEVAIPGTPHTAVNDPKFKTAADTTEADTTVDGTQKRLTENDDTLSDDGNVVKEDNK